MGIKYFTLLTLVGEKKLAAAIAAGKPLELVQMGVGDGNGVLPTPDSVQTRLVNERRRGVINSLTVDPSNTSQMIAEQVIPENEGGFWLREIGLYDVDGDLIAVGNCPETYKPELKEGSGRVQTVRMVLIVSHTDAVTMKFDPTVSLASRQYVDDKTLSSLAYTDTNVIEVKSYTDNLLAEHIAAANPHKQYAPIESPIFTGTPTALTPVAGDNSKKLATTEFVAAGLSGKMDKNQNGADIQNPVQFVKNLGLENRFSGRVLRMKKITSSQNYQWPDDVSAIDVTICGAGGGGGAAAASAQNYHSAGSGGGAGGWARSFYRKGDIPVLIHLDVGAGGIGGVDGKNDPGFGGATNFGSLMIASGGARGANGAAIAVGISVLIGNGGGGNASGGNLVAGFGGSGTPAMFFNSGYESGAGGDSVFSFGATPLASNASINGIDGVDGAGGSGGFEISGGVGTKGGNGGNGVIMIVEYSA
ncbi:phage tail protein [Dickeya fangzhongdai]|uniref:phage tail protein n=1 Tax=Dickeya fangzhongdai TaxID=1778540 RepID=UPI001EFB2175|nr:phage tail protein [Dickeya fangzhongdai]ULR30942.1 phage tail protein [Dickeya fangzhongdai]